MKRFIISLIFIIFSISVFAQYNNYHYYTYGYDEVQELNNITFNTNMFKHDPKIYNEYLDYCYYKNLYFKKQHKYEIVGYVGLGTTLISLIPMCIGLGMNSNNPNELIMSTIGYTGLGISCIELIVAYCGIWSCQDNIKQNKKNFINYLRIYNNGLGIVKTF